jgi:hypothetical protein
LDGFRLTAVLAVSGAFLAGCDDHSHDWQASTGPVRVCTDLRGQRVPDDQCAAPYHGVGASPFLWYYLGSLNQRSMVPPLGVPVTGGSYNPAPGVAYHGTASITRGGFGGLAALHGGDGGFRAGS